MWIEPLRRIQLLDFFRSLDAALDEHKEKGTPAGDPVYQKIFEQLAGDVAMVGFGKDEIPFVANECGQLSTYKRLEQLMTRQNQPQESAAIDLLNEQLERVQTIRDLDFKNPEFISWRDTVADLFQRFLSPDSSHLIRFRDLRFRNPSAPPARRLPFGYRGPLPGPRPISQAELEFFKQACTVAEGSIRGAIETIRNFGVHAQGVDMKKARQTGGGVQQTFHGPVTIQSQAIATDKAVQNIGQMGGAGASLKEIAALLQQSLELKGREVQEGLKAVEVVASEVQKPKERRDWKSLLDCGEKLLGIAGKATDVTAKLAPYLPQITLLVEEAAKRLRGE